MEESHPKRVEVEKTKREHIQTMWDMKELLVKVTNQAPSSGQLLRKSNQTRTTL